MDKYLKNTTIQVLIQGGFLIVVLSGIGFILGYKFELGVYRAFGIDSVSPTVGPNSYVNFLGNVITLILILIIISAYTDELIKKVSGTNRKSIWYYILYFTAVFSVFALFSVALNYFADNTSLGDSLNKTWNIYGIYIVLILAATTSVYLALDHVRSVFINNTKRVTKFKALHYSIEGVFALLIFLLGLVIIGEIAANIGTRSVIDATESYSFADAGNNEKYIVVEEYKDRLLGVPLCEDSPLKIMRGHYKFLVPTQVIMFTTSKEKITSDSFC